LDFIIFLHNLQPNGLDSFVVELSRSEQGTTTLLLHQSVADVRFAAGHLVRSCPRAQKMIKCVDMQQIFGEDREHSGELCSDIKGFGRTRGLFLASFATVNTGCSQYSLNIT